MHIFAPNFAATLLVMLICQATSAKPPVVRIGVEEPLYRYATQVDPQTPRLGSLVSTGNRSGGLGFDAPLCPLRINSTTMDFLLSSWAGIDIYQGTPRRPFTKRLPAHYYRSTDASSSIAASPAWTNATPIKGVDATGEAFNADLWIESVYKIDTSALLGFVHDECSSDTNKLGFYENCTYRTGLAVSGDGGETWTYCGGGDIIQPYTFVDHSPGSWNSLNNGGGGPGWPLFNNGCSAYIVHIDKGIPYFYLYFHEHFGAQDRVAVARAPVTSVCQYVRSDAAAIMDHRPQPKSPEWFKWDGRDWTLDAMSANCLTDHPANPLHAGSDLIDRVRPNVPSDMKSLVFDPSCGAYCSALGKYLLTLHDYRQPRRLLLGLSSDGVQWDFTTVIDSGTADPARTRQYSAIVSLDADAADDSHVVGKEFYVIYPHFVNATNGYDLYRRKITIVDNGKR